MVQQGNDVTKGLVCWKQCIHQLKLVAVHMTVNLARNVERVIDTVTVPSVHCWSDSTVALYWINPIWVNRQRNAYV